MSKRFLLIWSDISGALTIIAATPYDREILQIIPPDWTPYVLKAGLIATLILRLAGHYTAATTGSNEK